MKSDNSIPTTHKTAYPMNWSFGINHNSFILESTQTLFVVLRCAGSILGPPYFRLIQYSIVTIMYDQNSTCCIYISIIMIHIFTDSSHFTSSQMRFQFLACSCQGDWMRDRVHDVIKEGVAWWWNLDVHLFEFSIFWAWRFKLVVI